MLRMLAIVVLMLGTAMPVGAQDSDSDAVEAEETQSDADPVDDADLDDESYADAEDDDFRPSEDIPADQSIPFPTDI